jgi:TfoX/Sxy family transcriptional regulator of competence genes
MKWKKSSPKLVQTFDSVVPKKSDVQYRKMFGYPCCFINGNMFMGLHQENMVLRLSEKDKLNFLKLDNAHQFEPMPGRMMKEYVTVPPSLLQNKSSLRKWINKSLRYASQLPAKKHKRKNS